MYGQSVNWSDYAGLSGFGYGTGSPAQLQDLQKALTVGNEQNPPGSVVAGDGFAWRVESLEPVLHVTTYTMRHLRLFQQMPRRAAFNTNEEFNQIHSYGNVSGGLTFDEGGLPVEIDSTYERKIVPIKFMGVTGRVSHVATVVKPAHGSLIAQETVNKTMHFLRNLTELLYFGSSDLDSGQLDGLEHYITNDAGADYVIDLRGGTLDEEAAIDGALKIMAAESYGYPTHLFMAPEAKADFVKGFLDRGRFTIGSGSSSSPVGFDTNSFVSPAGNVQLEGDVFLSREAMIPVSSLAAEGSDTGRPGSPVITTAASAGANAASQFVTGDNGNYFYWVQAVNRAGSSAPVAVNAAALAVAVGDRVTFGVSPGPGPLPRYYKIFRTRVGGATGTARLIEKVAAAAGGGATTYNDDNENLPGTTKAFMIQLDNTNLSFAQLSPMTRIPLAQIDTSLRWAQIMYGALMMYTPRHNIMFKNIGRAAGSYGPGV